MSSKVSKKKRGPVEIIEGKGIKIPIYDSPIRGGSSFQLAFYKEGKRDRERTATIEAARKRAKELIEELASGKAHAGITFTAAQAAVIHDAVATLKPLNVTLTQAVREFADAARIINGHGSLAEAAHFFVRERQKHQ